MLQCTMPSWAKARPRHCGVPHEAVHLWRRRQRGERWPHLGLAEHAAERHCWASAGMCAGLGWSCCECGVLLCVLVLEGCCRRTSARTLWRTRVVALP
jgi:hypothetical protein